MGKPSTVVRVHGPGGGDDGGGLGGSDFHVASVVGLGSFLDQSQTRFTTGMVALFRWSAPRFP
jgi:hypothetical protein